LAALAITGVLFMHGFDAAAVDLTGTGHHASQEAAGAIHGVIGLCVFVVAATGLIATRWPARSRRQLPAPVSATVPVAAMEPVRRAGRPRLFELCVLRT
jgi:hypothetical protein